MAAELPKRKGRLAAKIVGNVKSASHRNIGAATRAFDRPKLERLAGRTSNASHIGCGRPSISGCMSAPATQTMARWWNFSFGPETVHSKAEAPSSLPTRRFASRNAKWSIGPDGGTPISQ